jgi:hypothetical protein
MEKPPPRRTAARRAYRFDIAPILRWQRPKEKLPFNWAPRIPRDLTSFIAAGTITQAILTDTNTALRNHITGQKMTSTTTTILIGTTQARPLRPRDRQHRLPAGRFVRGSPERSGHQESHLAARLRGNARPARAPKEVFDGGPSSKSDSFRWLFRRIRGRSKSDRALCDGQWETERVRRGEGG